MFDTNTSKMNDYFNVREFQCWITGGDRKEPKEKAPDTRKRRHRRSPSHRAKLYAYA